MTAKIGMITIGQSPRDDVVPDIKRFLGPGIEVLEAGALDGLSIEDVENMSPKNGDYMLVTRMRDGAQVTIGKSHILSRMQECIDDAKALIEEKGFKGFKEDILKAAIPLFEKRASHTVYWKESKCKEKFDAVNK